MVSPVAAAVLSPQVHWPVPARPDVASDAVAEKDTRSPTCAEVVAPMETVGAVRSTTTPSQDAAERFAFSADWLWLGPLGLSGIEASAAITHAHRLPSGALP